MSKQYDDTNRGVLFKNDRKQKDTHPDYQGKINVEGKEFKLAAWLREGKKGKFMSLSVSIDDGSRKERAEQPPAMAEDRDIPF